MAVLSAKSDFFKSQDASFWQLNLPTVWMASIRLPQSKGHKLQDERSYLYI